MRNTLLSSLDTSLVYGPASMPRLSPPAMPRPLSPPWRSVLRLLALAALPLMLAACNGSDNDEGGSPVAENPAPPADTRNPAYLAAKPGDVIKVRIEALRPTQAAIGYDQIYYKLGRWQGDFNRATWAADPAKQLDYLNRTVGKKFSDYCEDMGATTAQAFASIAEAQAARIDMARANNDVKPMDPKGDTVWFGVVDRDGNAVSLIQSIYYDFGSGIVPKGTGILMQNRGSFFSLDPKHVNHLEPRKRTFHTLNPAMLLKDGKPYLVYGTMGGEGQPQTQSALFTRYVTYKQPLERALDAPRWLLGRTWGSSHMNLRLERRFDENLIDRLMSARHDVGVLDADYSDTMGHAGAVVLHANGTLEGGHDPRADGGAAGV